MNQIEIIRGVSDVMDALGGCGGLHRCFFGVSSGFAKGLITQIADIAYKTFRIQSVRCLILGLEVLVAGDVIRTVAMSLTLTSVAVLGAIVVRNYC
ncbi:DUF1622 domain-containing protein [Polynucleobacter necessarius]|uniref:DUF1622 domain-containing protein n=1 Tax=Polynucleobacter necessarius TaxID=576610 RepID=UPI000E09670F|nr:DUF1622 domain-containing protein [Polynucleobacter necessarius]